MTHLTIPSVSEVIRPLDELVVSVLPYKEYNSHFSEVFMSFIRRKGERGMPPFNILSTTAGGGSILL